MRGPATLRSYREFLETVRATRSHCQTLYESWESREQDAFCIRHDVDRSLWHALLMARIEADMGIRATYYFLHPGDDEFGRNYYGHIANGRIVHTTELGAVAREIADMGHEIGLHNDFVNLSFLTRRSAQELLVEELEYFRSIGLEILGTAAHGSAFAIKHQFVNYELFSDPQIHPRGEVGRLVTEAGWEMALNAFPMSAVGLKYEAYHIDRGWYLSDGSGEFVISRRLPRMIDKFDDGGVVDLSVYAERMAESKGRIHALIHADWWKLTRTAFDQSIASSDDAGRGGGAAARAGCRRSPSKECEGRILPVRLASNSIECRPSCRPRVRSARSALAGFFDVAALSRAPSSTRMVVSLYSGNNRVEPKSATPKHQALAQRARTLGYFTEVFGWEQRAGDVHAIERSRAARAFGILRVPARLAARRRIRPFAWPTCSYHWCLSWGVFRDDRAAVATASHDSSERKTLRGYMRLERSGDVVFVTASAGHRDRAVDGIMELLLEDVISWASTGDEPFLKGVRCLIHGPHKGRGPSTAWKRAGGFEPVHVVGDIASSVGRQSPDSAALYQRYRESVPVLEG